MWRTRGFVRCAVQLEVVLICCGELTRGMECEVLFVVWRRVLLYKVQDAVVMRSVVVFVKGERFVGRRRGLYIYVVCHSPSRPEIDRNQASELYFEESGIPLRIDSSCVMFVTVGEDIIFTLRRDQT